MHRVREITRPLPQKFLEFLTELILGWKHFDQGNELALGAVLNLDDVMRGEPRAPLELSGAIRSFVRAI
jgi:hypothetical protein